MSLIALAALALAQNAECGLSSEMVWSGDPAAGLHVRAQSHCDGKGAVEVSLTFTNADGEVLDRQTYVKDQVMLLAWSGGAAFQGALDDWLDHMNRPRPTSELPGLCEPSEFPFLRDENLSEADYEALRAGNRNMLCYVQGMESERCLILEDGALVDVGIQIFPG